MYVNDVQMKHILCTDEVYSEWSKVPKPQVSIVRYECSYSSATIPAQ